MRLLLQLSTYHGAKYLPALFDSLCAQTDRDWQFVIRDDGSAPDALHAIRAVLETYNDTLSFSFFAEENLGFAGSHQKMFAQSDEELVLLVNQDVVLTPTYIESVRSVMMKHDDVAAAEGVMLRCTYRDDGGPVFSSTIDSLGFARTRSHKVYDIGAGKTYEQIAEPFVDRFGVSGCLPMYRRAALGGELFDPAYWMYKEDVDVAYRLHTRGWRSVLVSTARAYHGRTLQSSLLHIGVSSRMQEYSYRNHWRNLARHLTWRDWMRDGWAIVPFEAAKVGFMLLRYPNALWNVVRSSLGV